MRAEVVVTFSKRLATILISFCALVSVAQQKKEVSYQVGPKAVISITNNYGPITIKPSPTGEVLITMISHSKTVSFENEQHGNRVQLRSVSPAQGTNLAEFTVLVPGDACVTLQSSSGVLRAEELHGDLIFETSTGAVEVNNIRKGHVHVPTLSGSTTLAGIHHSHLDVNSVSGNINLRDITGSSAVVHSGTGRIAYQGDPGPAGAYSAYHSLWRHRSIDSGDFFRRYQLSLDVYTVCPRIGGRREWRQRGKPEFPAKVEDFQSFRVCAAFIPRQDSCATTLNKARAAGCARAKSNGTDPQS